MKKDTLLAHCLARAAVADAGGVEAAEATYGSNAEALRASKWKTFRVAAKVTPKAARVAAFVSMWGLALYDQGRDELTVDEYADWANEPRATAFRRAAEYRELWPEVDVNVLAGRVRDHIRDHKDARRNPMGLTSIVIAA